MELLKTLGFDPIMLVAQILNFLIIFYLLKRFLYKPVMDMIKTREDKIALGLKQTEEARLLLEKTQADEKKILSKAQDSAKEIIEEAKNQALTMTSEMENLAKEQTEKIMLEAKEQIATEVSDAERRLSGKISTLAADMLTKSLKGVFSEKEQKVIVGKALKSIKRID